MYVPLWLCAIIWSLTEPILMRFAVTYFVYYINFVLHYILSFWNWITTTQCLSLCMSSCLPSKHITTYNISMLLKIHTRIYTHDCNPVRGSQGTLFAVNGQFGYSREKLRAVSTSFILSTTISNYWMILTLYNNNMIRGMSTVILSHPGLFCTTSMPAKRGEFNHPPVSGASL